MGVALEAGLDLGGLAGCLVAIGLVAIILTILEGLDAILNVSILGVRPFAGIARRLENTLIHGLKVAEGYLEQKAADFFYGMTDAMILVVVAPLLVVLGVRKALEYLWSAALKPTIHAITNPIRATANQALSLARTAERDALNAVTHAEAAVTPLIATALRNAESYADRQADAALGAAQRYAAGAVEALRGAESAAIASAGRIAAEARAAGDAALAEAIATTTRIAAEARAAGAAAVAELPRSIRDALGEAEHTAAHLAAVAALEAEHVATAAIAEAQAQSEAALAVVAGVADAARGGVIDIEELIRANGWAALIASVPALAILVHAIATESGLENASCRGKVKNICQTDASAWEGLIAGLVAVGLAFNLRELAAVARPLVEELAPIVARAA